MENINANPHDSKALFHAFANLFSNSQIQCARHTRLKPFFGIMFTLKLMHQFFAIWKHDQEWPANRLVCIFIWTAACAFGHNYSIVISWIIDKYVWFANVSAIRIMHCIHFQRACSTVGARKSIDRLFAIFISVWLFSSCRRLSTLFFGVFPTSAPGIDFLGPYSYFTDRPK